MLSTEGMSVNLTTEKAGLQSLIEMILTAVGEDGHPYEERGAVTLIR
ncbi:uncharacterized protein METZ01_LOCUS453159 [marine metagenome]|uniref:Uncharacterized protein n=1 Tax=marine metagenome TaxID=408172 RepID=A0A382ZZD4_9ZZZZ